jgi:predicted nucleic acid-binding protein
MLDRGLVDTNVLVYSADPAEGVKRDLALGLLEGLRSRNGLVVSVQVLNEFYHRSTRPNRPPSLSHDEALRIVTDLTRVAEILPLTTSVALRALDAIPRL